MPEITTKGRITALLGRRQMETRVHMSLRRLAALAQVPKDLVYRLDAGDARYIELGAVARLCHVLRCRPEDMLAFNDEEIGGESD